MCKGFESHSKNNPSGDSMKKSISNILSIRMAGAVLVAAGLLLTGCDAPTSALSDVESSDTADDVALSAGGDSIDDLTETLAVELEMTAKQQASINQAAIDADMQRHAAPGVRAGRLWYLSARLQQFLSERQKEKLFRIAAHHADGQLHKLVGVYAPCTIHRPGDTDHPRLVRIHLIADLLSDEQRSQIEEIRARYGAEIQAIQERAEQGDLTREEALEQIRGLVDSSETEIRAVLSADQIATLDERLSAAGPDAENHLAHSRRAMIDALGLRDTQVDVLDALHRTQCEAFETLIRRLHAEEITREEFKEGLKRLVSAKLSVYGDVLGERQFEAAKIHDALLVINARRYVNHVVGGTNARPDAVTDAVTGTR